MNEPTTLQVHLMDSSPDKPAKWMVDIVSYWVSRIASTSWKFETRSILATIFFRFLAYPEKESRALAYLCFFILSVL